MLRIKFLFGILFFSALAAADTFWLKGATLIDPAAEKKEKVDLKIQGGRVKRAKLMVPVPPGEKVIDVTGKFIIPGIYDMHVHVTFGNPAPGGVHERLSPEELSRIVLRGGITGVLDLSADESIIFPARDEIRKSEEGADLFVAGPMITCPGGHGSDLGYPTRTVSNVKEAEQQINDLAKKHPDAIKIAVDHYGEETPAKPVMDDATLRAVIRTAKKHKLKTIVHIGNWDDAKEAILAGADVITHLYDQDIPDSLIELMKQKQVIEIPTMTYQTELLRILENRNMMGAPLIAQLIPVSSIVAYRTMDPAKDSFIKRILDWQVRGRYSYPRSLAKLVRAGIPLLAGTDSGVPGSIHGHAVHREMELMVNAGLSTWKAIASGTVAAKKFLSKPSGIADGNIADLVVLKSDPVVDIVNTQTVELVVHNGKVAWGGE